MTEPSSTATPGLPDATLFRTRAENRRRLEPAVDAAMRPLVNRSRDAGWVTPLTYNTTISHSHRFVWFRVAKVATRTIRHHLVEHGVTLDADHAMRIRFPWASFEDYFTFAFVRDPLERFVSAWRDKVVDHNYYRFDEATHIRMQDVEEFARWVGTHDLTQLPEADQHIALQSRLIDLNRVDFLGRIEDFDTDFAQVCTRLGIAASPAAPRNQTAPRGHRTDVSDDLRAMVHTLYARDYQIFGY